MLGLITCGTGCVLILSTVLLPFVLLPKENESLTFPLSGYPGIGIPSYKSKQLKRDLEEDRTYLAMKYLQDSVIEISEVTGTVHIRNSPGWPPNIIFKFSGHPST